MTTGLALTRTELELPPLQLQDGPAGYRIVGTPAFTRMRVEPIYAPTVAWVDGEHVSHKRKTNGDYSFSVLVMGTTAAELDARLDALEDAVWQYGFVAQWQVAGGHLESWRCQVGNIENVGGDEGGKDELRLRLHKTTVRVYGRHLGPA